MGTQDIDGDQRFAANIIKTSNGSAAEWLGEVTMVQRSFRSFSGRYSHLRTFSIHLSRSPIPQNQPRVLVLPNLLCEF